jgi:hypothetical protein
LDQPSDPSLFPKYCHSTGGAQVLRVQDTAMHRQLPGGGRLGQRTNSMGRGPSKSQRQSRQELSSKRHSQEGTGQGGGGKMQGGIWGPLSGA